MFLAYIACFLLLLYYIYSKHYSYWQSKNVPTDKPFLFFGSFYNLVIRKEHIFERIRTIYNQFSTPYVGIYIFHQPVLLIRSPEILRKVLVKDFDKFTNRNIATNESADPLAFHTLFISKDAVWRNLRTKLSPVFTSGKMKLMFPLMQECVDDLRRFLEDHTEEIDVKTAMKKYSVDIISTCAFGINTYCFRNDNSEILKMATQLVDFKSVIRSISVFSFFFMPSFVDIFRLTFVDKTASDYLINVFKTTLQEREKKKIIRNDFIDLLSNLRKTETITDSYKFDNDIKMAAQAIAFFSAGNDTTSITLALTCYELSLNKTIQDRLRHEVTEIYNENGEFTYENILGMKYLDMVISETLRKYPLAPFLNRKSDVKYTFEETGFTLDKGVSIMVPISGLHYDPEYYPDPEKYDPERFSDENKKNLTPYTYLPFGEGPRNCIGQRFALLVSKVALASVVKDFVFDPTERTPVPLRFDPGSLFVQNRGGLYLKVSKIV
uniref:Cytochrome P450 n=1 Tax=Tribolium castaneum TaxID=7070 RepID=A7LFI0_TRICA|nr:cytochrome P450 [Tribolium castaneum]